MKSDYTFSVTRTGRQWRCNGHGNGLQVPTFCFLFIYVYIFSFAAFDLNAQNQKQPVACCIFLPKQVDDDVPHASQ